MSEQMHYSERRRIANAVEAWMKKGKVVPSLFNYITALAHIGFLRGCDDLRGLDPSTLIEEEPKKEEAPKACTHCWHIMDKSFVSHRVGYSIVKHWFTCCHCGRMQPFHEEDILSYPSFLSEKHGKFVPVAESEVPEPEALSPPCVDRQPHCWHGLNKFLVAADRHSPPVWRYRVVCCRCNIRAEVAKADMLEAAKHACERWHGPFAPWHTSES